MNKSESIKELATALAKAQGEIKGALKDSQNPFFKSKYADLAEISAAQAFLAAGALAPLSIDYEDVIVQEYPTANKLVFLFQRRIAGREHFYPYVFDLPADMVAGLRASGRWGRKH